MGRAILGDKVLWFVHPSLISKSGVWFKSYSNVNSDLTNTWTDILKDHFFCAVKTLVLKFCARKSAKITPKIT